MIDRKVFNTEIAVLAEMHRHELAEPTIDRYYDLLTGRMTTAQFEQMCRRLEMSARSFWPLPADFLPPVQERLGVEALDAAARAEGLNPGERQPVALLGSVRTGAMDEHGKLKGGKALPSKVGDVLPLVQPKREGAA